MFNTGICFRFPFNRSLSRHGHPHCFFLFFVAFSSSPSIHYSKGSSFSSHRSLTIIKNNEHCGCNIFGHKGNDCRNHYYCLSYNFHTTPRGNMRQFRTCFNGTWICCGALKMGKKTENCRLITLTCLCVYIECNFFQFKWLFHNKKNYTIFFICITYTWNTQLKGILWLQERGVKVLDEFSLRTCFCALPGSGGVFWWNKFNCIYQIFSEGRKLLWEEYTMLVQAFVETGWICKSVLCSRFHVQLEF